MSSSPLKSFLEAWNFSKKPAQPSEITTILRRVVIPIDMWGFFLVILSIYRSSLITADYDGLYYILLAYAIHLSRSRVAAGVVIFFAVTDLIASASHFSSHAIESSLYVAVYLILSISGFRALQLTRAYHRSIRSRFNPKNACLKSAFALIYALIITSGFLFTVYSLWPPMEARLNADPDIIGTVVILILAIGLFGFLPGTRNRPMCVPTSPSGHLPP